MSQKADCDAERGGVVVASAARKVIAHGAAPSGSAAIS